MKKVALIILDGFGLAPPWGGNAIFLAKTPFFDKILSNNPNSTLVASGEAVGLPFGEPGNSESGHLNIGAGKVVHQDVKHISDLIKNDTFYQNKVLIEAMSRIKKNQSNLHIAGLVSDGGIHSHIDHLLALLTLCKKEEVKNVYIHIFTDGRDTEPQEALKFLEKLQKKIKSIGIGKIASVSGRFYAMDRDKHDERINLVYNVMASAAGPKENKAEAAITKSYKQGFTDEYVTPASITNVPIKNNDSLIFFNVRGDRMIQLVTRFANANIKNLFIVTFTWYGHEIKNTQFAFPPEEVKFPLARVISENNLSQLHIAETEKYAHVTYFFNGGIEKKFKNEQRIVIPSKRVKNYKEYPAMSASEITNTVISELKTKLYYLLVINYANADMVGHSGDLKATTAAIEVLDAEIKKLTSYLLNHYEIIITADHGKAEQMVNPKTGDSDPEHTINPVPFIILSKSVKYTLKPQGILAFIAPTILQIMGIDKSKEMSGESLIK